MSRRPRLILVTTAAVLALLGILVLRARRNISAAPASVLRPTTAVVVSGDPARALQAPAAVTPPFLEAPEARFRRQVVEMSAEFDRLRSLPDDIENFRASAELENEYAVALERNPAMAAMLVREMPPGFADTHFGTLALLRWANTARAEAAAWMGPHPAGTASAAQALARGWLAEDEAALNAHLAALPAGVWRGKLALTASEDAFLAKRPEAVLGLLDYAVPGDARREQLAEWNATAWAIQDPEAARAWAGKVPDVARRAVLLAAVAIGEANRDPSVAARRLFETVTAPDAQLGAVRAIARIWTRHDAEAAARWAGDLPAGPVREAAEEGLLAVAAPSN